MYPPAFKILCIWISAVDVVELPVNGYSLRTILVAYFFCCCYRCQMKKQRRNDQRNQLKPNQRLQHLSLLKLKYPLADLISVLVLSKKPKSILMLILCMQKRLMLVKHNQGLLLVAQSNIFHLKRCRFAFLFLGLIFNHVYIVSVTVVITLCQNRKVCVLCNLKPATMRGIKSQAMVLAASNHDHTKVCADLLLGLMSRSSLLQVDVLYYMSSTSF